MNPTQKAYDSYDKNNMLLKTTENKYHHQNLALIRNRKNKYAAPAKSIHSRKPDLEQDNKFLFSKIRDINNRSSKPQLNDMFIRDGAKKKQFNQKMRKYELQSIEQENAEIGMRLKMKKSFLDVKRMDEEYKIEHQKILDKIRKIHPGLVLPIIPQKGRGRVTKTEANKKEDEKEYEETKEQEEQKDNEANEAQNEEK